MPKVEKLSIALTTKMAKLVRKAVEDGEYASNSEVVREALRDWTLKRSVQQKELEVLRDLWEEGSKSGAGRFSNIEEIKMEARQRFEKDNEAEQ